MKKTLLAVALAVVAGQLSAAPMEDRFVWVFGWNVRDPKSVTEISKLLETASHAGLNGAVMSGFDTLCQLSPEELGRLQEIQKACESNHMELIPAIFSVGYGGGMLSHNHNLAEGLPVDNAPFVVSGKEARLVPDANVKMVNGDFEQYSGNNFKGFGFHDKPGEVSFVDTQVFHSGKASIRLENFKADQHGHGRVEQEIKVRPHRSYRVSIWVKTQGLAPTSGFQMMALASGDRNVAPRKFDIPSTTDWRKISMLVNSLENEKLQLYAGIWGGTSGKLWFDDWMIEEVGPVNVLHRPGTPVTVQNQDSSVTYTEGKDYAPLFDPNFAPWHDTAAALPLKILADSRIHDGDALRVSWYHSMIIYDGQITVCMGEPALYDIFDHESKLLAEKFHPKRVLLNMDEIRMGGTCKACGGKDMAQLLGQCVTRQTESIRKYSPGAQVYIWSDMFDPNHNAHPDYYLVEGDFTGSWKYLPKDMIMAAWGGEPMPKTMKFFSDLGFQTLAACYYDADDLKDVKAWLALARQTPKARGLMYTPWERKYSLLPAFGDLLK